MNEQDINEQEWKQLLLEDPARGISMAIDSYGDCVRWIARKIIGSGQLDIEECTSDVFVKLWQGIERFDPEQGGSLKSYVCGIARYTALDYRRKNQRQGEWIPIEDAELQVSVDFENEVAREMNARIVQETIDELPPPDKDIFILRYFLEEKISVIAARLKLPDKTVENKLYRGKVKLKESLIARGIIL